MRRTSFLALAMITIGCGAEPAAPSSSVVPAASTLAPPRTVAVAPPTSVAPPTTVASDPATRAQLRDAMRQGRAASHAGRHADALAAFRRAVALDPTNRRLRCEAGYVAHLAGDDASAAAWIDDVLQGISSPEDVPAPLRVTYAMCFYNAGLVYEARGRSDAARRAWTTSLALRPNATVQGHLDGLAGSASDAPTFTASMSDDELAARVVRARLRWLGLDPDETQIATERTPIARHTGVGGDVEAFLVTMRDNDGATEDVQEMLVVRAHGEVAAFAVAEVTTGASGGVGGNLSVTGAEIVDLVPGGEPEIVLETSQESSDTDYMGCVEYGAEATTSIVCTADGPIACASVTTSSSSTASCDEDCLRDFDTHCGRDGNPIAGTHDDAGTMATLTWTAGIATLEDADGHTEELPIGALVRRFAVAPL